MLLRFPWFSDNLLKHNNYTSIEMQLVPKRDFKIQITDDLMIFL